YLDVEAIEDVRESATAQRLLARDAVQRCFAELRAAEYVEYEKVYRLKLRFLKLGFRQFLRGHGSVEFQSYVESEGDLLDSFAVYCALDEVIHKRNRDIWIWPDWPEQ